MTLLGLTWDQWQLVIFGAMTMLMPSLIVLAILFWRNR